MSCQSSLDLDRAPVRVKLRSTPLRLAGRTSAASGSCAGTRPRGMPQARRCSQCTTSACDSPKIRFANDDPHNKLELLKHRFAIFDAGKALPRLSCCASFADAQRATAAQHPAASSRSAAAHGAAQPTASAAAARMPAPQPADAPQPVAGPQPAAPAPFAPSVADMRAAAPDARPEPMLSSVPAHLGTEEQVALTLQLLRHGSSVCCLLAHS